jgi:hypothetical protein
MVAALVLVACTGAVVADDTQTTSTSTAALEPITTLAGSEDDPVAFSRVYSIAYPPDWYYADSSLMPNLGFRSFTVASMPLRPGGENCAQVPENSLRDMSRGDVLLTVFFRGTLDPTSNPFSEALTESSFPAQRTETELCAERETLEVHWGDFSLGGESIYVLLVFGEDVDPELREEAWSVLRSFHKEVDVSDRVGGVCVITRPGTPDFVPPDPFNPKPSTEGYLWYGSPEVWTVLPSIGVYEPRMSVWWSAGFDGRNTNSPDLQVRWLRLDAHQPPIENETATSGQTPEDGWFMIAGFDPPGSGCWQVTATYGDASLSYVYESH